MRQTGPLIGPKYIFKMGHESKVPSPGPFESPWSYLKSNTYSQCQCKDQQSTTWFILSNTLDESHCIYHCILQRPLYVCKIGPIAAMPCVSVSSLGFQNDQILRITCHKARQCSCKGHYSLHSLPRGLLLCYQLASCKVKVNQSKPKYLVFIGPINFCFLADVMYQPKIMKVP